MSELNDEIARIEIALGLTLEEANLLANLLGNIKVVDADETTLRLYRRLVFYIQETRDNA